MANKDIQIGKSGVLTTPLGLGTNAVGGNNLFPNLNDETGIQVVKKGLDSGINMLDTAFAYGMGHSEELIAEAIKDYDRSKITIATKGAQDVSGSEVNVNNSPEFLKQAVEESLERLNTNYLDVFYIHFPDDHTPKDQAVAALNELKQQGKIKAIGVSNFSLAQLKEANKNDQVDIVENQYSLIHRDNEKEIFPYLREHNISFVPYFPLASGLLTGKFNDKKLNFAKGDMRNDNPDFKGERFEKVIDAVNEIKPIADEDDASIAQVVLAWYMKNPNVSVVIPGAKRPEQVDSNAQAMNVQLTDDQYQTIDDAFSEFK